MIVTIMNCEYMNCVNNNEFIVFQNYILIYFLIRSCLNVPQVRESFYPFDFLNILFYWLCSYHFMEIPASLIHSAWNCSENKEGRSNGYFFHLGKER